MLAATGAATPRDRPLVQDIWHYELGMVLELGLRPPSLLRGIYCGASLRRPTALLQGNTQMTVKCPSCSSTDWLFVARGERRYVRCRDCGQIKLLPVRKSPLKSVRSTEAFPTDLFSAADSSVGPVIS